MIGIETSSAAFSHRSVFSVNFPVRKKICLQFELTFGLSCFFPYCAQFAVHSIDSCVKERDMMIFQTKINVKLNNIWSNNGRNSQIQIDYCLLRRMTVYRRSILSVWALCEMWKTNMFPFVVALQSTKPRWKREKFIVVWCDFHECFILLKLSLPRRWYLSFTNERTRNFSFCVGERHHCQNTSIFTPLLSKIAVWAIHSPPNPTRKTELRMNGRASITTTTTLVGGFFALALLT